MLNKNRDYIRKVIAVLLMLDGVRLLLSQAWDLAGTYAQLSSPLFPDYAFSVILFRIIPLLIIYVFTFISGLFLLTTRRAGWVCATAVCATHCILVVTGFLDFFGEGGRQTEQNLPVIGMLIGILHLLAYPLFLWLLLIPLRRWAEPRDVHWITSGVLTIAGMSGIVYFRFS